MTPMQPDEHAQIVGSAAKPIRDSIVVHVHAATLERLDQPEGDSARAHPRPRVRLKGRLDAHPLFLPALIMRSQHR